MAEPRLLPRKAGSTSRLPTALIGWLLFGVLVSPRPLYAADPEWAATASFLLPGLGQAMNQDYAAGALHFSLSWVLARQYLILSDKPEYIKPKDRADDATYTYRMNRTTFTADLYGTAANDLSMYSAFSAYRDARNRPENRLGYTTPAPQESLGDLAVSPFRWEFLSRPTTFLPLLFPLYAVFSPTPSDRYVYQPDDTITRDEMRQGFFIQGEMVAVGEESFFRGVLNNGFSDWLGPHWGLLASSSVFGLAHSGQSGTANPLQATVFGLYLGWLQQSNDYALGEGVALHFWWDFLTSLVLLKKHENTPVTVARVHFRF